MDPCHPPRLHKYATSAATAIATATAPATATASAVGTAIATANYFCSFLFFILSNGGDPLSCFPCPGYIPMGPVRLWFPLSPITANFFD